MLFTKLFPLLKDKCDTITITMARASESHVRLSLIPKLSHANAAIAEGLNSPLQITATPAELDGPEFHEMLSRFTVSATGLAEAGAAIEAEHVKAVAAAKATRSGKPTPKPTPKPAAKAPAPQAAAAPEPEPEEEDTETETAPAPQDEGGSLGI